MNCVARRGLMQVATRVVLIATLAIVVAARAAPAVVETPVGILSHGQMLDGELRNPPGSAARPLLILMHGYPGGRDRDADLASAVATAGYAVLVFSPRGMWSSSGEFSFAGSLEDVSAVLDWAHSAEAAARFHLDAARIALAGHSFGGWLALMAAARQPATVCAAGLAAWNVGWVGERFAAHPDERAALVENLRGDETTHGGPVRGNAAAQVAEIEAQGRNWDYLGEAAALAPHPLLLVTASEDSPDEDQAMHAALARAVVERGGRAPRLAHFSDGHRFLAHRADLARTLLDWLASDCASAWR